MARFTDTLLTEPTSPRVPPVPIVGASIFVLASTGQPASLTDDNGNTIVQPFYTGTDGTYYFNIPDPGDICRLQFRYGGRLIREIDQIVGAPAQLRGPPGADNLTLAWSQDLPVAVGQSQFTTAQPFAPNAVSVFLGGQAIGPSGFTTPSNNQITLINTDGTSFSPANASTLTVKAFEPASGAIYVSPEDYGAVGNGVANDTAAFAAMSSAINAAGGGRISMRGGATYLVGKQTFNGATGKGSSYYASNIMDFANCPLGVVIDGNGAKVRWASGLRFGSFDPVTGAVYNPLSMPFYNVDYRGLLAVTIQAANCASLVVRDLEIDGNQSGMILGGTWGDTGRQLSHFGIIWQSTPGYATNVNVHHMCLDGLLVLFPNYTSTMPSMPVTLIGCKSLYNARQALSWVGGRGLTAIQCKFNFTGQGTFLSAPASGLDIEAESSVCRDGSFIRCEFIGNAGLAVISDSGDSANNSLTDCIVIAGTNTYALWLAKPGWSVTRGEVVGPSTQFYQDSSGSASVQIRQTRFYDNPAKSPLGALKSGPIIDMGATAANPLFDGAQFLLTNAAQLPYTPNGARYNNIVATQASTNATVMSGVYTGVNVITTTGAAPNLVNSGFPYGTTTVNGTVYGPKSPALVDYDPRVTGSGFSANFTYDRFWSSPDATRGIIQAQATGSMGGPVTITVISKATNGFTTRIANGGTAQDIAAGVVMYQG